MQVDRRFWFCYGVKQLLIDDKAKLVVKQVRKVPGLIQIFIINAYLKKGKEMYQRMLLVILVMFVFTGCATVPVN